MPFEGAEKKLALMIHPAVSGTPLRQLDTSFWKTVVAAAGARILSDIRSESSTAYLLSESSLFVWDHRLVLITCGLTRPLQALEALGRAVPLDCLVKVLYQRRPEVFSEAQPTRFSDDRRQLLRRFPGRDLAVGNDPRRQVQLFVYDRDAGTGAAPDTLEILMTAIHADVCGEIQAGVPAHENTSGKLGHHLRRWFPGFDWDEHWFRPPGYSANGLQGADYATIHITPQAKGSYASLETSATGPVSPSTFIEEVLAYFRPREALVLGYGRRAISLQTAGATLYAYSSQLLSRQELASCGEWPVTGLACQRHRERSPVSDLTP
ncbi:MAG: hypothetical protein JXQ27_15685 [Acidobacteria bacterium]|nr:hypothetical protein [Acidobacteriota bacterium]